MRHTYGWQKDKLDQRDIPYKVARKATALQTTNNRYTATMPSIVDQGELGSCTGNACASIMNFLYLNGHLEVQMQPSPVPFSRLFIYYQERVIENTVLYDAGAQIRDGVKALNKYGACSENNLPYNVKDFAKKPHPAAYIEAENFTALSYQRLDNTDIHQLVDCLIKGFPFVFGFTVHESFETDKVAKTGIVPVPKKTEKPLGGHCCYAIDFDAKKKGFWCINSWGSDWGKSGLFFMPQSYMTNAKLAADFWTIQQIK